MKIGGRTPNRVRFGLLACQLLPKATGEEKSEEQTEEKVDEPHAKKQKPTSDPTWWALGDVIIPKVCGGSFRYEVNSFGSFKSSSAEEAVRSCDDNERSGGTWFGRPPPNETKTSTSDLWKNFMELARNQLLPLARAGIIHPDIRVGYDYTANIMAKSDGSNMVLVDFESLVLFSDYTVQEDKHRLYLPEMKNAFAFVCLQCYVVAVFWSEKKNQLVEAGARTPLKYALYGKDVLEADVEGLLREIALQLENSGRLDTALLRNLLLSNN